MTPCQHPDDLQPAMRIQQVIFYGIKGQSENAVRRPLRGLLLDECRGSEVAIEDAKDLAMRQFLPKLSDSSDDLRPAILREKADLSRPFAEPPPIEVGVFLIKL